MEGQRLYEVRMRATDQGSQEAIVKGKAIEDGYKPSMARLYWLPERERMLEEHERDYWREERGPRTPREDAKARIEQIRRGLEEESRTA